MALGWLNNSLFEVKSMFSSFPISFLPLYDCNYTFRFFFNLNKNNYDKFKQSSIKEKVKR